jgi:hypothetical protein
VRGLSFGYILLSKLRYDIALRGPSDFGFAAWVIKTAKAPGPGEHPLSRDLCYLAWVTREDGGASTLPPNESARYCESRSTARGAD